MQSQEHLTIREAARKLGLTPPAIRSRARFRNVELVAEDGPHGTRYLINACDLDRLRDAPEVSQDDPAEQETGIPETVARKGSVSRNETVPLVAHLEALKALRESQRSLQEAQRQSQSLQDETRRAERQAMALQWELTGYRRALAEKAESSVEQSGETRRKIEQAQAERALLEAENARQRELFEREKAALSEGLLQSRTRVAWLEKRVPTWLRRMLGAS